MSLSLKLCRFMNLKPKQILIKTFIESQLEIIYVYEFQTKVNSYEDIGWASVWSYVTLWVSNQSEFSWKYLLSLSLKLSMFMSFKQKRILINKFVDSQLELLLVYEFQTKAYSSEDICWASVWSYLILWVWNKNEFWWRHLLSLSLNLSRFTSFKPRRILMKAFVESKFKVL